MARAQNHLFSMMSPSLQGEVAWAANKKWLERIHFLKYCGADFKVELAMSLEAKVFAPGEVAPKGNLYVIHRGLALYGARVLTAGKIWGDDVILLNTELHSPYQARAMNYLECYTIGRDDIFNVASAYPRSRRQLRRSAMLMALRRRLALVAQNAIHDCHIPELQATPVITLASKIEEKMGSEDDGAEVGDSVAYTVKVTNSHVDEVSRTVTHIDQDVVKVEKDVRKVSAAVDAVKAEQQTQRKMLELIMRHLGVDPPPAYQPPADHLPPAADQPSSAADQPSGSTAPNSQYRV
jgi:hypothetical protein